MIKKCFLVASLLLLMAAVAGPSLVSAEGDSLASPTPLPPERVTAPEISGVNPDVVLSEGNQGETHPSDILSAFEIQLPFPVNPPQYVQLKPLPIRDAKTVVKSLAVPLRIQDAGEVTCGVQALGMLMDFRGPLSGEAVPTDDQLISYISSQGLLYEWGTGVEELAYTARAFGYAGSYAFHNWTLKQLTEQLLLGIPVVVSLGANGTGRPGHFVTVTGISDDGRWVVYNDPLLGRMTVPANEFLNQWKNQGNAGLIVQKETLPAGVDPMLPWMGFFSALSMLTLAVGRSGASGKNRAFNDLRRKLSDPKRKGIGGGLTAPVDLEPETIKVPRHETKTVYQGLKTVTLEIPVYEIKKVKVGFRGFKKKVPIYETRRIQVGFETISKKIPEYITKRIKVGTKTIKQQIPVTRYRNKKVMEWKKVTKRIPVYRTIGSKRIMIGTRKETRWKRVPVIKRVRYQSTKTITRQVPVYENRRFLKGYRTVTEKVPKYEQKRIVAGYKTVTKTEPVYEEQRVQVGTKTVTRQVPDYQTVQIPVGDDQIPRQEVKDPDIPKKDQQSLDEIFEIPQLKAFDKKFEVTDVVYLKGGPGAKSYGETAEDGYIKHSSGGESLPAMRAFGLLSKILVWIRDNTKIIERMGGKPDAQAMIFYTEDGTNKVIDEIQITNTGNETLYIQRISVSIEGEGVDQSKKNVFNIYPPDNPIITNLDYNKIKPGSLSRPINFLPIEIGNNQVGEIVIGLVTESNRFGSIEHHISKISDE
jgi:predicted double-glycine peptidase